MRHINKHRKFAVKSAIEHLNVSIDYAEAALKLQPFGDSLSDDAGFSSPYAVDLLVTLRDTLQGKLQDKSYKVPKQSKEK